MAFDSNSNITSKVVEVIHEIEIPTQENGKEETNGKVGGGIGVGGDDVNEETDMNDEVSLTFLNSYLNKT